MSICTIEIGRTNHEVLSFKKLEPGHRVPLEFGNSYVPVEVGKDESVTVYLRDAQWEPGSLNMQCVDDWLQILKRKYGEITLRLGYYDIGSELVLEGQESDLEILRLKQPPLVGQKSWEITHYKV